MIEVTVKTCEECGHELDCFGDCDYCTEQANAKKARELTKAIQSDFKRHIEKAVAEKETVRDVLEAVREYFPAVERRDVMPAWRAKQKWLENN